MNGFVTSRADIEIFGKTREREDIIPVEFEEDLSNISFIIKKTEFLYALIKKSGIFAVNILKSGFEKERDLCLMNEGRFTDKFKLAGFEKEECSSIDCPCIRDSEVYECEFEKETAAKDEIMLTGRVLTMRKA